MRRKMCFKDLKAAINNEEDMEFRWVKTFPEPSPGEFLHRKVSPVLIFKELVESCEQVFFAPAVEMHNAGVRFHPGLVFGSEYVFFLKLQRADVQPNHRNHAEFRFLVWDSHEKVVIQGDVSFFFP